MIFITSIIIFVYELVRQNIFPLHLQEDYQKAAQLYKRATNIKESDPGYGVKVTSRRSSTADTVSTLKHIGAQAQFFD